MGDEGEFWKDVRPAMKEMSRNQRKRNRKNGESVLFMAQVPFLKKNHGAHLIVFPDDPAKRIDYWPGTGLWRSWGGLTEGRGIESLMRYLKQFSEV